MDIYKTVLVEFVGKGYYSGNEEIHSCFIPENIYLEYKDDIETYTPFFYELDGKHSEVQGKVLVNKVTKSSLRELLLKYNNADDSYKIFDMLGDYLTESEMHETSELFDFIEENLQVEVITSVWFGEENLGD